MVKENNLHQEFKVINEDSQMLKYLDQMQINNLSDNQEYQQILIVDDDEFNIFTIHKLLEMLKVKHDQNLFAMNGKEALDILLSEKFQCSLNLNIKHLCCSSGHDLILMDLNMPEMDGFDATKLIRGMIIEQKIKDVYIVGTTAHQISEQLRQKCLATGFNDVISKPIMRKTL